MFVLLFSPVVTDLTVLSPREVASELRELGELLVTVAVFSTVLLSCVNAFLRSNLSKSGVFYQALTKKIRVQRGVNHFSTINLEAVWLDPADQEPN